MAGEKDERGSSVETVYYVLSTMIMMIMTTMNRM
jgi:hypothetical protein